MGLGFNMEKYNKIVIIGESGSGKTELALNIALYVRERTEKPVYFLDMDQTKSLFRSRDAADYLRKNNIIFDVKKQFMDAPVVPNGVCTILNNPDVYAILDVGGNRIGAVCLGQFADSLQNANTIVLYVINYYRCFSDTTERIRRTMAETLSCSSFQNVKIVSNPYLGANTTANDINSGNKQLSEILKPLGMGICLTLISNKLWHQSEVEISSNLFPITPFMSKVIDLAPKSND
ncbi:ATP-binding protein [Tepidanaerobacter acetatoxydans]|uniref:ATP-binding protein n=1 Tax=Tepidanaerobacter acetatoxydans TaxID=499229 RepID=UPI001BD4B8DB|nr:ATP-binding protein [Tepidanaerobacter acetatoxydans]